jgi:hypothetical protein
MISSKLKNTQSLQAGTVCQLPELEMPQGGIMTAIMRYQEV